MHHSKPLRVTLVTSHFHPDYSATGQLLTELAVGLRRMGCEMLVYTAHPSYGTRTRKSSVEFHEGVEIRRVLSTTLDKDRRLGRVLNAVTFFASVFWVLLWRRSQGPLLIVSNPPFLGVLGYALNLLRRQRYVYLVHDVFPDLAVTLGYLKPNGLLRKLWDRTNEMVVVHASQVVVLGEAMKSRVLGKAPGRALEEKVHVVHNWADETFIRPLPKRENAFANSHELVEPFVVLYSGNLGLSQDLETVIAAAERLRERHMVFLFIGEGGKKRKLMALAEERGLHKVRFLPYQRREVLPLSSTCADVSLVALERGVEGISMPSKLYTIMASGRAVVALVERGFEVARIVETARCGRSVDPSDVDGLVGVLDFYERNRDACARDGANGRKYFEAHFTRDRALGRYLEVLEAATPAEERRKPLERPVEAGERLGG